MAVSLETMLENLEEVLEEGMSVPLSGGKRMVDVDAARDIIDDIRINMPQEILQAKAIVQDRAQILAKAKKEAEEMVRAAEERARVLLNREEIVRQAEEKAKAITAEANQQATQLRATVTKYCDNMLATTQEQLQKSYNELKIVRDNLKK
ncbi:MAG: ATPase [Oscillospiraceae bacterium]|nr:ATPase [Oscillospiraceae bacterium]